MLCYNHKINVQYLTAHSIHPFLHAVGHQAFRHKSKYNCNKQVVKVILHKTASPPQTDGLIVFARWRQCAHMGGHIGATWRKRLNPNGISIGSAVSAQLMAECPYTLQWATLSPKLPLLVGVGGGSGPHLIHYFLGQTEPTVQTESRSVQLFSHR